MKQKNKVLLTSLAAIAMSASMIAGGTYALFTSESEVNIAVTSGKVDVVANVTNVKLYSAVADEAGTLTDENGGTYSHEEVTTKGKFTNGGTAVYANGTLTLDKITPGDKVSFEVTGTNDSNVDVLYRVKIECEDGAYLASALHTTIDETTVEGLLTYVSEWNTLSPETDMENVTIEIDLPIRTGNDFRDLTTEISVKVEAVQGNASVDDSEAGTTVVAYPESAEELDKAISMGGEITLLKNIVLDRSVTVPVGRTVVLDLNGKNITSSITGAPAILNEGTLTINGKGAVDNEISNAVKNTGTLEINGGTYTAGSYAINNDGGSVTVNQATATADGGIYTNNGTLVINGGDFDAVSTSRHGVYAYDSTVTVNGGSIRQSGTTSTVMAAGMSAITVNGGDISVAEGYYTFDFNGMPVLRINGGSVKGMIRFISNGTTEINGGNVNLSKGTYVAATHTLTVSCGTYETDITAYVAEGYKAVKLSSTTYAVVPEVSDSVYPTTAEGSTLETVFGESMDFGYNDNGSAEGLLLDGLGVAEIGKWTDAWFYNDLTIKGVTFKKGATFSAKNLPADGATITLENCTFYACDQDELTEAEYQRIDNSGDGMCLNIETAAGLRVVIKNCTFIGDGGVDVERNGYKNWTSVNSGSLDKARGHAIAINAISGNSTDKFESVRIEDCTITNVRGNAIQLYTFDKPITIKNTTINSWGQNKQTLAGEKSDSAIRGDLAEGASSDLLTLENVTFGMDEADANGDGTVDLLHVNVNGYAGNTDGTRKAGTY